MKKIQSLFTLFVILGSLNAVFAQTITPASPLNNNYYSEVPEKTMFNLLDRDTKNRYKQIINIMPLSFFISGLELGFERKLGDSSSASIKISAAYYTAEDPKEYENTSSKEGFKIEVQPRYYIGSKRDVLNNFYFGGYAYYKQLDLIIKEHYSYDENTGQQTLKPGGPFTAQVASAGVLFGYQLITVSRISFDGYVGGGLIKPINSFDSSFFNDDTMNPFKRGIAPRIGVSIGYAFN